MMNTLDIGMLNGENQRLESGKVRRSFKIALFLLGAMAVRGWISIVLYRAAVGMGHGTPALSLIAMVCDGSVMIAFSWAGMVLLRLEKSRVFPTSWSGKTALWSGAGGICVAAANYWILTRFFPSAESSSAVVDAYIHGGRSVETVSLGLGLLVIAPIVEEIYFRGLVQGALDEISPAMAVIVASLLFVNFHPGAATSPAIWILGFALGLLRSYTRSVSSAIVCHVMNNAAAIAFLALANR